MALFSLSSFDDFLPQTVCLDGSFLATRRHWRLGKKQFFMFAQKQPRRDGLTLSSRELIEGTKRGLVFRKQEKTICRSVAGS